MVVAIGTRLSLGMDGRQKWVPRKMRRQPLLGQRLWRLM